MPDLFFRKPQEHHDTQDEPLQHDPGLAHFPQYAKLSIIQLFAGIAYRSAGRYREYTVSVVWLKTDVVALLAPLY